VKVQIVVFDGFDELDAVAPYEVFSMSAGAGASLAVDYVVLGEPRTVVARHGLLMTVNRTWDPEAFGIHFIPGGNWGDADKPGVRAEIADGKIAKCLAAVPGPGRIVASVCTGAMLLAAAGLTTGRRATTHRAAREDLVRAGADLVDARVVDDGDLVTAGGITSGLDLALWLVEREFGAYIAHRVSRGLEYERSDDVRTADDSTLMQATTSEGR